MVKAFLYDENGGVFRCMFAGLDCKGDAKWVNITPNEESYAFVYVDSEMAANIQPPLKLISLEGESVKTKTIVRMVNNIMRKNNNPIPLREAFDRMRDIELKWEKNSIEVNVNVRGNRNSKKFPYTLFIEAMMNGELIGSFSLYFADFSDMFSAIGNYMITIEALAKIRITQKTLCIDEEYKNMAEKYFCRFDTVDYFEKK